ncbi:aspartyl-phosphate phosphatase Spo0E family protein [Paenibacillus sp. S150]|uniref:aspartyl-phosphate phosphatase Spo0E family protein n=1 Tax=Paenibacillus sp. S150 TaxID=2749826 RepID=UPI001C5966EB|nr:aspartyl-phosphate phosphatase Spo0E family protein [Paenibacillus sp. S150]MBW4081523.1 aspartyl-phosphate phosphatase Spo0E family protein [Paenibacillus sp. S150]
MKKLEVIQKRIEAERRKLNEMETTYGLLHPKVIKQSMKLDDLINEYTREESLRSDPFKS